MRGHVRLAGHRRVSHGLFLPLKGGLTRDEEQIRDLAAWRAVLPARSAFTHVTAARVLGWRLPALPDQIPVFAAVGGDHPRPQRSGLVYSRLVRGDNPVLVRGVPVDTPEEVLLRAARDLSVLDLVIMVDSALRMRHIDHARMDNLLDSRRPGVRQLRQAWSLSDRRSESGGETLLRLFHVAIQVPVEPQVTLVDQKDRAIGRADLLVVGTRDVHEYDGEVHRSMDQHRSDLRRERRLAEAAYRRRGFSLDDLLNHPVTVMHEIDRALGRPHRPSRARDWQRLVADSLYRERGRERVLNRWRRVNGFTDWSKPA